MLYALGGSLLLGALSTAFLLWRKARVEKALVASQAREKAALTTAETAMEEMAKRQEIYVDQLMRRDETITLIRKQRDEALEKLVKTGSPGSVLDLLRAHTLPQAPHKP